MTAFTLKEQYHQTKRVYYECKNIEKALLHHIQDSIEDCYLETMVNEDTALLPKDMLTVLQYLFDNYWVVPTDEVREKSLNLGNDLPSSWSYGYPIQSYWTAQEIGCISKLLLYQITNVWHWIDSYAKTGDLEQVLGEWAIKPPGFAKRCTAFKDNFRKAQELVQEIQGTTMQQTGIMVYNGMPS